MPTRTAAKIKVWNYPDDNGQLAPVDGAAYIEFYMRGKKVGIPVPRGGDRDAAIAQLETAGIIWEAVWEGPTQ